MIEVEHVTKYYGAHPAVRDLDFRIEEGECIGFLGLNGAGKTTTLRLLSCLLLPTSGRVRIRGLDAEEQPHEIRKFIGFLPDDPPVYEEMTVRAYLRFAGQLRRMNKDAIDKRLPEVLESCGLKDVADQPIATLSHGYRQRVGIGQAIVHDPALLILDEPIQGLDPVQIVEMREMIRGLRGKHTILLSTHILSEIEQTCDRILMLHEGRIAAQGTEQELASRFGEGALIELEVRMPHDAAGGYRSAPGTGESAVQQALSAIDEIQETEITPRDESTLHVRLNTRADVRERVSRALVEAGLGLLSLRRLSTGLERIFVELSREHRRHEGKTEGVTAAASAGAVPSGQSSSDTVSDGEERA
jgi:ABC-2 type transport system ATP-binding protein